MCTQFCSETGELHTLQGCPPSPSVCPPLPPPPFSVQGYSMLNYPSSLVVPHNAALQNTYYWWVRGGVQSPQHVWVGGWGGAVPQSGEVCEVITAVSSGLEQAGCMSAPPYLTAPLTLTPTLACPPPQGAAAGL